MFVLFCLVFLLLRSAGLCFLLTLVVVFFLFASSLPTFPPNSPPISCLPITMHAKLDVEAKIVGLGMNAGREGYANDGAPSRMRQ